MDFLEQSTARQKVLNKSILYAEDSLKEEQLLCQKALLEEYVMTLCLP
jgi:hypothetical protein